jgi:geranylgeranyl diphosphate synthase type II
MSATAVEILRRHGAATDAYLREALKRMLSDAPPRLTEAIEYSLFAGGKRLRPALVLETYSALAARPSPMAPSALAAAGAIELIHTFSLVHDDLPAMDNDDLRRGRPTCHRVFGETMAILAGDAMTTLAFELIGTDADPSIAATMSVELARAAGPVGMIGGQVLDIAAENATLTLEALQDVHRRKTGALICTACRLGAIAAHAAPAPLANIDRYARHAGLAFQIIDDILDETSTPEQLGKATQKDASRGKNTYPALLGLDRSRGEAARQVDLALAALEGFDARADGLRAFARFILDRQT